MSFLRGYLRFSLKRATKQSNLSRFISFAIIACLISGGMLLGNWAGRAERSSANGKSNSSPASIKKTIAGSTGQDDPPEPAQGCTVGCDATVPASGAVNAAINFASSATTNGCSTPPTFEWNFGDGTARSNQQNTTHTYSAAGTYNWSLTASVSTGATMIDTVAGGFGEGNLATQSPFGTLVAAARDPQNRGLYVVDVIGGNTLIRFINTSASAVTIAGRSVAPGTVRAIAGGGTDLAVGIPGTRADLGVVTGLDVSADGNLLYFSAQIDQQIRVLNVSANAITVAGNSVASGNIGLLASGFGDGLGGLVVNANGEVFVADGTPGINKVYRVSTAGTLTTIAGNGATSRPDDPFATGPALNTPLLQPRAVELDNSNRVVIADTGHGRVIRIETNGNVSLVSQFTITEGSPNPYPSSLAVQGSNIYAVLGNQQTVVRLSGSPVVVAGQTGQSCDYSVSSCGDGGTGTGSAFGFSGSTGNPPYTGIAADGTGIFILDQALTGRGRIRFLNTSGNSTTLSGITIAANAIDRIGGNGLVSPYDGGLATSATMNAPVGMAVDASGNLWIADQLSNRLRFVNRGATSTKIFTGTASEQTVAPGGIVTVNKNAGTGASDNVPVIQAGFINPQGMFITSQGIYIVDSLGGPNVPMQANGRKTSILRFINTTSATVTLFAGAGTPISVPAGQIAKIAGGGESTTVNGDGGFALNAKFIGMSDVVVDSNGNITVTDVGQNAVRRINGGNGQVSSILTGKQYTGLGRGPDNRVYVANFTDGTVLRENTAGGGTFGGLASGLNKPRDVAVAADGTAYVTIGPATNVTANNQIVQISTGGTPTVIAGTTAGFSGDGGAAASAQINIQPSALVVGTGTANQLPETVNIVVGPTGEIFFADSNNNRIRRVSPSTVTCTKTGTITVTGDNPVPTLALLNPSSALVGSGALNLTVEGTGFVPSSKVRWNNQDRTTMFVSNTQLTASIPATDLLSAGTISVTVFNAAPGGGTSNAQNFTVSPPNPFPSIGSITPNTAVDGSAAFTIRVNGSGFVANSVVRWDGQNRQTEFVSDSILRAQVLASDLVGTGQASVTVLNPPPGGGTSNIASFTITAGQNPSPTLTGLSPNSATAGGGAFTLTVNGTNFVASSRVRWNGQDLSTLFTSNTQLTASVPANLISSAGAVTVTVFTPTPGGGVSASQTFTVNPGGAPSVASVSAASFLGTNIAPESIVAAFGTNLATGVAIGSTVPLPTNLLGTKVTVRDSAGTSRDAGLFFVAATQINYQVPPGTAEGNATVTVTINNNTVAIGSMNVSKVAPGLFSANASGQGVASAVLLRIRNGVQTFEPISRLENGVQVPIEIDLGPAGDIVYLLNFGTGLRARSAPGNISVTLGSITKSLNPNDFEDAFAAPGFIGLDQANILLPRTLIGAGLINLTMTIDGKASNTVQVRIK
ncbi:MAG: PKD domain-containing protein [Acidobacteriota bacterium]|nr:PKD domain-containing protein [Acidobacteriota bacterium]